MENRKRQFSDGKDGEKLARDWFESHGYDVHDANILFGYNCPNIDLVVYGKSRAFYVQVKSSVWVNGSEINVHGSPWTESKLYKNSPIYNRHDHFEAEFVLIVFRPPGRDVEYYLAPPLELEEMLRPLAVAYHKTPLERGPRKGMQRSIGFMPTLSKENLKKYQNAWQQLVAPPREVVQSCSNLPPT